MTHIVNEVRVYDRTRWKVTLDEGALTFLLYPGEAKRFCLHRTDTENTASGAAGTPGPAEWAPEKQSKEQSLSEAQLQAVRTEVLLPRAKKRVLYYLKGGDKTEYQIRQKLKDGLYPEEIISETLTFLKKYRLADDARLAENYIEEMKGTRSRREMEAKLCRKGLKGERVKELLSELAPEEEYGACEKALRRRPPKDKRKDAAYLMRRGFSWDAVEHALEACADAYADQTENFSEEDN